MTENTEFICAVKNLYDCKWVNGPYVNNKNRVFYILRFADDTRLSKSYAKLLMEIHLGKILGRDETVDHIDGNPRNDVIENLQVLSRSENARKGPASEVAAKIRELNRERMNRPDVKRKMIEVTSGENNGQAKISNKEVEFSERSSPTML